MPSYNSDERKKDIYRRIIEDHYRRPRNKGLVNDDTYKTIHLKNPSCGDDLTVQLKTENEELKDIRQSGSGCAICCASASVMSERLKGRKKPDALKIIDEYKKMLSGEEFDEELLDEAAAFQGVSKLPPRIKCAALAWTACEEGLLSDAGRSPNQELDDEKK